jgi:hypothetical protein
VRVEYGVRRVQPVAAVRLELQPPRMGRVCAGLLRFTLARGVLELVAVGVVLWLA